VLEAARLLYTKGLVLHALGSLALSIDTHFKPWATVDIFSKPSRKVVALNVSPIGVVVLGPDTTGLKVVPREDTHADQDGSVEVVLEPEDPKNRFVLTPAAAAENVSPLWCIATTENEDEANMSWIKCAVSCVIGMDYEGKPRPQATKGRKKIPRKSEESTNPEDEATERVVKIPVLINHKALQKGDTLLLYKPRVERRVREVEAITIAKLAKRAKLAQ
jgi:hypothetical protein